MLISDLKNLDGYFFMVIIALFISIVAPGVLTIYLFLPELFKELTGLTFLLFSISLSLPIFTINAFFVLLSERLLETEPDFRSIGLVASFMSSMVMFSCLLSAYILALPFKKFLICLTIIEILILAIFKTMLKQHNNAINKT